MHLTSRDQNSINVVSVPTKEHRKQQKKNKSSNTFDLFDRESFSHGPTSLKIVVVVLVGVLKTLVLFFILSMKYSSYPQYFIFSMKYFTFSMKYFIFSIKSFIEIEI